MKKIGITQRVERVQVYEESRDCLDQRWTRLANQLGIMLIPLPNTYNLDSDTLLKELSLEAILFSGGNTIASLEDNPEKAAPERDQFEKLLLEAAINQGIPVLGVCRGMQIINIKLGGDLAAVEGQAGIYHDIVVADNCETVFPTNVNSYHNWAIEPAGIGKDLEILALDPQGYVEAFRHKKEKIAGIMWHPERENPARKEDLDLIRKLLSL